jgi:hypothetical protein
MFLSPLPRVLSLDAYSHQQTSNVREELERAYQLSSGVGRRPWIIGETDNRSIASANAIRDFLMARRHDVLYVLQWPGFNCAGERECLPLDFSVFALRGM